MPREALTLPVRRQAAVHPGYQLWRFSHRFMGVLFAIVVFHQFFDPTGLKDGTLKGLRTLAQTPRRVRFEHFEFA